MHLLFWVWVWSHSPDLGMGGVLVILGIKGVFLKNNKIVDP